MYAKELLGHLRDYKDGKLEESIPVLPAEIDRVWPKVQCFKNDGVKLMDTKRRGSHDKFSKIKRGKAVVRNWFSFLCLFGCVACVVVFG